jgi:hypothetical protein
MIKRTVVCGLVAMAGVVIASAEEFPLTFRTIPAKDVMSFPGGFAGSISLRSERPEKLRREPRAVSQHPLYSVAREGVAGTGLLLRLDESRGDGKGYDRLIVDMNQNGDLTDDPVAQPAVLSTARRTSPMDQILFGPIQAPADKALVGGRPVYYAHVYTYNRQLLFAGQTSQNIMFGQVMLKAGWYLDTTVTLNGLRQKVGVFDGDANQHLGDVAQPQTFTTRGATTWSFRAGDSFLVDTDGSGSFESSLFQTESCAFGALLYLGSKAYKVALAADCRSLRVDAWPVPLADLALQPRGDQVHTVTLAWEPPGGKWQLIQPPVNDGKAKVPAGNYRLYACNLLGKGSPRDQVMLSGTQRTPQMPVNVAAGKGNTLNCGAPLDISVTATKSRSATRGLFGESSSDTAAGSLRISATVAGAGGEVYSTFQKGDGFQSKPPKPIFTIRQAGGQEVASGNLEYG